MGGGGGELLKEARGTGGGGGGPMAIDAPPCHTTGTPVPRLPKQGPRQRAEPHSALAHLRQHDSSGGGRELGSDAEAVPGLGLGLAQDVPAVVLVQLQLQLRQDVRRGDAQRLALGIAAVRGRRLRGILSPCRCRGRPRGLDLRETGAGGGGCGREEKSQTSAAACSLAANQQRLAVMSGAKDAHLGPLGGVCAQRGHSTGTAPNRNLAVP